MKKGLVFFLVGILLIFAAEVSVQALDRCEYMRRCIEDTYWYWHEEDPGNYYRTDSTRSVRDGEGDIYLSQDRVWIMMDMGAWEKERHGSFWTETWWNFGLIVSYDPSTCDTVPVDTIKLPDYGPAEPQATYHGLAYNENDNTFWYSKANLSGFSYPAGGLYHIDASGDSLDYFDVNQLGITGVAFDADHNHLWCIISGDPDMLIEYDIFLDIPVLIQGPFPVPWFSPTDSSAAGLDYDECRNMLIAVNKNANRLECFKDIDPAYPGPPGVNEPGVVPYAMCDIESTPHPWGICLNTSTQTVFVADNAPGGPFPLDQYESPCFRTCVVCPDGSGDFYTIQEAINAACDGDTIELCDWRFTGIGNRDIDFLGKAITVRSQGGAEACTVDCWTGSRDTQHRGFFFHQGEGPGSVLEGVTIMNGILLHPIDARGGGILCIGSSPTITNCRIVDNWADDGGGGIYCDDASPIISGCEISGNGTDGIGGGICCVNASPGIRGCAVTGNWAGVNGGGIYWDDASDLTIISCTVSGNNAYTGGGFYGEGDANRPRHSIVWGNCAESGEGNDWYGDGGCRVHCCNCIDPNRIDGFGMCVITCSGNRPNTDQDPWFCCPQPCDSAPTAEGDYMLCENSPCAPGNSPGDCGLIGALDIGSCPVTDPNGDGSVGAGDVVYLISYLFRGDPPPDPLEAGDVNCDGVVDSSDIVYLLNYLFKGGPPPCCYCPE